MKVCFTHCPYSYYRISYNLRQILHLHIYVNIIYVRCPICKTVAKKAPSHFHMGIDKCKHLKRYRSQEEWNMIKHAGTTQLFLLEYLVKCGLTSSKAN